MSHFCVLVIGDAPEEQLEQYDEQLDLPMHKVYSKEELIAKKRRWIEEYKNTYYQEYLDDPENYKSDHHHADHIKFLEKQFPRMLKWSDEECYEAAIQPYRDYIEEGDTWCEIHKDGSLWQTTNENAKYDYYVLGGRYPGRLKLAEGAKPIVPLCEDGCYSNEAFERLKKENRCNKAFRRDVVNLDSFFPFAIVKDGEWYERGSMGWWAIVSDEKEEGVWEEEVRKLLTGLPDDTILSVYDCHI